ncbi:unnamed protein product [Cuscuta campestris]|uniref:NAC domain-containing protein n=1 Tax=Cuscuta campestris TaxID=132261 RepID=A0A484M7K6_9ASTE|nr:unnamed protein product [Cuscuta campestris]
MEVSVYHQDPNNLLPVAESEAPPPVGYRFQPADSELLDHYLRRLIHEEPLPVSYPRIILANVYADHPSAIWSPGAAHDDTGSGAELHCYFYTELQRWGEGSGSTGHWVLGYDKYFNYKPNTIHPGDVEYEWGMHGFTLHGSDNKYALCKITRRARRKKLTRGAIGESAATLLSNNNQQQEGDGIGFGEIVLSNRTDPAIRGCFDKVSDHDEVGSSSPPPPPPSTTTFTLGGDTDRQQRRYCQGSMVTTTTTTTSSVCFELEEFGDIFLDLGDLIQLDDNVREEDCRHHHQRPTVGSIGSQQQQNTLPAAKELASKKERARGCAEHDDQHVVHDAGADGAKRCRHC